MQNRGEYQASASAAKRVINPFISAIQPRRDRFRLHSRKGLLSIHFMTPRFKDTFLRLVQMLEKDPATPKKFKEIYETVPIHSPEITVKVYTQSMEAPVTIIACSLFGSTHSSSKRHYSPSHYTNDSEALATRNLPYVCSNLNLLTSPNMDQATRSRCQVPWLILKYSGPHICTNRNFLSSVRIASITAKNKARNW